MEYSSFYLGKLIQILISVKADRHIINKIANYWFDYWSLNLEKMTYEYVVNERNDIENIVFQNQSVLAIVEASDFISDIARKSFRKIIRNNLTVLNNPLPDEEMMVNLDEMNIEMQILSIKIQLLCEYTINKLQINRNEIISRIMTNSVLCLLNNVETLAQSIYDDLID